MCRPTCRCSRLRRDPSRTAPCCRRPGSAARHFGGHRCRWPRRSGGPVRSQQGLRWSVGQDRSDPGRAGAGRPDGHMSGRVEHEVAVRVHGQCHVLRRSCISSARWSSTRWRLHNRVPRGRAQISTAAMSRPRREQPGHRAHPYHQRPDKRGGVRRWPVCAAQCGFLYALTSPGTVQRGESRAKSPATDRSTAARASSNGARSPTARHSTCVPSRKTISRVAA